MSRADIKRKIMETSNEIAEIREAGRAHREKMLQERARHEASRHGRDGGEAPGIGCMLQAEKLKRKYAELRKFKHPKYRMAHNIEVPAGNKEIDSMWEILKEEKRDIEEIEWNKITDDREMADYLIRWCIRHFVQAAETPLYKGGVEKRPRP